MKLLVWKTSPGGRLVRPLCFLLLLFIVLHLALVQKRAYSASGQTLLRRVNTESRRAALTFNIKWGDTVSPQILDILDEYNVSATFFVSGPWAGVQPEILARMHRERHEIGNYGYTTEDLSDSSPDEIKAEIGQAQELIAATTGYIPAYFRPPSGNYNDKVVRAAAESGYVTVIWDVDSLDRRNPGVKRIAAQVLKNVQPGSIILLHASDDRKQTVEALPLILAGLQESGYHLVTLSCLLCSEAAD